MPWRAKTYGAYSNDSSEAHDNALMVYDILHNRGWTNNAIAGMWGNVGWESGYNPWRWESDDVLSTLDIEEIQSSTIHGYGLAQFTPSGRYIYDADAQNYPGFRPNFSNRVGAPEDGNAQILYIELKPGYYQTAAYPLSYQQYRESEQPPDYLAMAWLYNYERGVGGDEARKSNAIYWFDFFNNITPEKKKFKWIYYLRRRL